MDNEIPAEITEARELAATAAANLALAEDAEAAARVDLQVIAAKVTEAEIARTVADVAEAAARADYVAVLRRHGYVQTADGPARAHTVHQ